MVFPFLLIYHAYCNSLTYHDFQFKTANGKGLRSYGTCGTIVSVWGNRCKTCASPSP